MALHPHGRKGSIMARTGGKMTLAVPTWLVAFRAFQMQNGRRRYVNAEPAGTLKRHGSHHRDGPSHWSQHGDAPPALPQPLYQKAAYHAANPLAQRLARHFCHSYG